MRRLLVLVALVPIGVSGSAVAAVDAGAARLQLKATCVTKAERKRVVRFRAADGIRLIGRGARLRPARRRARARLSAERLRLDPPGTPARAWPATGCSSSTTATTARRAYTASATGGSTTTWSGPSGRSGRAAPAPSSSPARRWARTAVLAGASAAAARRRRRRQPLGADALLERRRGSAPFGSLAVPTLFVAAEQDDPFDDDAQTLFNASAAREKQLEVRARARPHTALRCSAFAVRPLALRRVPAHPLADRYRELESERGAGASRPSAI